MLRSLLARLDAYMLLLLAMVALGAVLPARGQVAEAVEWAVHAAVALLFFLYGARLAPAAIWAGISHWRLQSLVFLSTFALFPLIGIATYWATRGFLPEEVALGLLFLSVLPSTVQSSIAFTGIARGNVPAALCSASLSNLLGVAITPLFVALLFPRASGGGISMQAFIDIAVQLLAPFIAGQVARPFIGAFLLRHRKLTSMADRGSILLVVYSAFSAGMVAGIWSRLEVTDLIAVLAVALVILAIVIGATTFASRALGFSKADEIAIVFCGSKKSMASGIPMATILIPGHGVGMIVLPLMIFHQVQLFACAVLARRYAERSDDGADAAAPVLA